MRKAILIILSLIVMLFVFNSCECQHEWKEATCTEPKTCSSCGKTEGETIEHTYTTGKCTDKQYCTVCNAEKEGFEHTWSKANCLENKVCTVCGEVGEVVNHSWIAPSCLESRHCSKCDASDGQPLGHAPSPVTCEETQVCLRCEKILRKPIDHSWQEATCKAPKTCLNCGATEGKIGDHAWEIIEEIVPTCANGRTVYLCACGQTKTLTKSPVKEYHMCDENAYCPDCNTQFDQSKFTLESIVISGGKVSRAGIFSSTEIKNKIYKTIVADDIGMPVIDFTNNDFSKVTTSRDNPTSFTIQYDDGKIDFSCTALLRIQGASSVGHPKKNYSVKLVDAQGDNKKVILDSSWGKAHKYCLKANYVDYSQARNVVSGQIYGDVISSRDVTDELTKLANGGAIDGFPVIVFNNGVFHGLYTLNIPKDKWMFDMEDSDLKNQAILMGGDWTSSVAFRAPMANNKISSGWELEYASNEDSLVDKNTDWVAVSMNNLIRFVMENDGEDFKKGISQYADVDKCIDSMLYTFFICADDNISKNILWVTYDGTVWFSSVYDMDGTWGMKWNGTIAYNENTHSISNLANGGADAGRSHENYNLLWEKIYINFFDRVVERYAELRQEVFTVENVTTRFEAFFAKIPDAVRRAESQKWTAVPSQNVNHLEQILDFAQKRIIAMDAILLK